MGFVALLFGALVSWICFEDNNGVNNGVLFGFVAGGIVYGVTLLVLAIVPAGRDEEDS